MFFDLFLENFQEELFDARWPLIWSARLESDGVPRKPGLECLLDTLDRLNIPAAVASSSDKNEIETCLLRSSLSSRLQALTSAEEVARGKPEPDIFLLAAERLGVAAERCLVVEDSEAGLLAGQRAGMQTVWVPDLQEVSPQVKAASSTVCKDLSELADLLVACVGKFS